MSIGDQPQIPAEQYDAWMRQYGLVARETGRSGLSDFYREYQNQWENNYPRMFPSLDRRPDHRPANPMLLFGERLVSEIVLQEGVICFPGYSGQALAIRVNRMSSRPEQITIRIDRLTIADRFMRVAMTNEARRFGHMELIVPNLGRMEFSNCALVEVGTSMTDDTIRICHNVVILSMPRSFEPVRPSPTAQLPFGIRSATPAEYAAGLEATRQGIRAASAIMGIDLDAEHTAMLRDGLPQAAPMTSGNIQAVPGEAQANMDGLKPVEQPKKKVNRWDHSKKRIILQ